MGMFKVSRAKSPEDYIHSLPEPRRTQIQVLHNLIRATLPHRDSYIESGMLGYGRYHYRYASGREGDWCLVGLANNKHYMSLYVCATSGKQYLPEKYRKQLPKTSIGKSCIRFRDLNDLNLEVIKKLLIEADSLGG